MQSDQDTHILPSNANVKVDEKTVMVNTLEIKLENVVKTEYVEYDIKMEPKCEVNADSLKRHEDVMDDRNNNKENVLNNSMDLGVKQREASTKVDHLPVPDTNSYDGSDFGIPAKVRMVDQAGSVIGDKDRRKFFYQQLLQELVYARNCCKNKSNIQQSQCNISGCKMYRNLVCHISICQAGDKCTVVNCSISRLILSHFDSCSKLNCALCLPLKSQPGITSGSNNSNSSQAPIESNQQVRVLQMESAEVLRAKEVNLNLREERLRIREKVLEVKTKDLDKQKLELEKQEFSLTVAQVNLWHREALVKEREENLSCNGNMREQNNVLDTRTAETIGNRVSSHLMQAIIKEAPEMTNVQAKGKTQGCEETLPPRKRPRTITPRLVNITNGARYPLKLYSSDPFLPQFN